MAKMKGKIGRAATKSLSLPDRIVRAALDLLEERPMAELTYREIAVRAGVSHMAPYRYFKTIEHILLRVCEEGDGELRKIIQGVIEAYPLDPERQIHELGIRYFEFALKNRVLFSIITSDLFTKKGEVMPMLLERRRETFGAVIQIVRSAQLNGILSLEKNSEELAFILWSLFHGLTLLHTQNSSKLMKSSLDPKQVMKDATDSVLNGMRKP